MTYVVTVKAIARQACLIWAGLVIGVSFLATPAKFLAPSLSLLPALDVGRQTFFVLNRVELILGLVLATVPLWSSAPRSARLLIWVVPGLLAVVQAAWLLPMLDARVEQLMAGGVPAPSPLHQVYIGVELAKLALLLGLGLIGAHGRPHAAEQSRRRTVAIPYGKET